MIYFPIHHCTVRDLARLEAINPWKISFPVPRFYFHIQAAQPKKLAHPTLPPSPTLFKLSNACFFHFSPEPHPFSLLPSNGHVLLHDVRILSALRGDGRSHRPPPVAPLAGLDVAPGGTGREGNREIWV